MPAPDSASFPRRGFLARLSAAAAGLTALAAVPDRLRAAPAPPARDVSPDGPDAWIDRLTGKDRVVLHAHQHLLPAVVGARNLLTNGRDAYGIPEREHSVAVATHGPAIAGMFRNEIWQQFTLGERYKLTDPKTGAPVTTNPFLAPQDGAPDDAVVPALMQRGVLFVVCNVAVRNLSRRIVREGESPEALHKELVAGLLPGVIVVPDLFVAISHAQKRGVSYIFIDA
jgi:intracellular sulfur oxidation DsrE/DsrF family protein